MLVTEICNCCCYSPPEADKAIQQKNHPLTYFEAFLSDESEIFIQRAMKIFEATTELVQTITALRRRYNALPLEAQYRIQEPFERAVRGKVVFPHMCWFVRMWAFVNCEEPAFDDEQLSGFGEKYTEEIIRFVLSKSSDFSRKGYEAITYFGKTVEFAYKSLRIVNNAGAQNNEIWNLNRVNSGLVLGICLIFQRVVEDLAPKVSRNIKLFQKYQLTYRKRKG